MAEYDNNFTCGELNGEEYQLISDSQDVRELLDYVGLPKVYREYITAAIVIVGNADYEAIFLSESWRYYELFSWYHPLPCYLTSRMGYKKYNLPEYWQKTNPYYHK